MSFGRAKLHFCIFTVCGNIYYGCFGTSSNRIWYYYLYVRGARLCIDSNELAEHSDVECQSASPIYFTATCWQLLTHYDKCHI